MNINLLPWREERRRIRDRKMVANGIFIWMICGGIVFAGMTYFQNKQAYQNKRNNYLDVEIRKLDKKIAEIKTLRSQKENLLVRMQVIQNLQRQRRRVVHLFDDIVRKQPEGVYYESVYKKKNNFNLNGTAQSNARVSDLMNRLDSSEWFDNPNLSVIDITPRQGVRLSRFQLKVSEESSKGEDFTGVN